MRALSQGLSQRHEDRGPKALLTSLNLHGLVANEQWVKAILDLVEDGYEQGSMQ